MRNVIGYRTRRLVPDPNDLASALASKVVGQATAVSSIVPYVQMYQAGLAPEGRPVGVFLLLGPSGTGKTRTVEALASVLHGSEKNVLRVDCGEYQMEHEVAKLIGAPPGYLGHRETQPMLTQVKLNAVTSERNSLSLVLLDEIEKAAPSMARLLLGVLDKASLRLGDNNTVNFERSMIFMTSNLGASEMLRALRPDFGFQSMVDQPVEDAAAAVERIGMNAVRKKFAPEFVNRIDAVLTYRPLGRDSLEAILEQQLAGLQAHITNRLAQRSFPLEISDAARNFLIERGTSTQYGARELKRTIHRQLIQPIAAMVANGLIEPAEPVYADLDEGGEKLNLSTEPPPRSKRPKAA